MCFIFPLPCEPSPQSHHGLTAFQKLHRDDAKRKFKKGLKKLRSLTHLHDMSAAFSLTKAKLGDKIRTFEEKKGAFA